MTRWNETRPRWYQRTVTRLALAALAGGLVGANAGSIGHGAYLFFVDPCAWHAATITGLGAGDDGGAYVGLRYRRGGVVDRTQTADTMAALAVVGERVWVQQCQQGLGQVDDSAIDMRPQQEGADAPQRSTD